MEKKRKADYKACRARVNIQLRLDNSFTVNGICLFLLSYHVFFKAKGPEWSGIW